MITLYSFGDAFDVTDPSPFVLKVDAFMRLSNIEFTRDVNGINAMQKAPKKKLPYIQDNERIIADSYFIIEYLQQRYPSELDSHLTDKQQAQAYCIHQMLSESFYWCIVYFRWAHDETWKTVKETFFGSMPYPLKVIVPMVARKQVKKSLFQQGFGRHSETELLAIAKKSLDTVAALLGDQQFMFGDKVSSIDATVFAFLAQIMLVNLISPLSPFAQQYPTLLAYCERFQKAYYAG